MKHNYDAIRIEKLLGFNIDVKKSNTFESVAEYIKINSSLLKNIPNAPRKILENRHNPHPNSIRLLYACGFELKRNNKKQYDIYYGSELVYISDLPLQVYYTYIILEKLSKYPLFKNKYMENDNIMLKDLVQIEYNICAKYPPPLPKKPDSFIDIGILVNGKSKQLIGIEIDEYEHYSKELQDMKRYDDLFRENTDKINIFSIISLRLNQKGFVSEKEINGLVRNVFNRIETLENIFCQSRREFIINYLFKNKIGSKNCCSILFDCHNNLESFGFELDSYDIFLPNIINKKHKKNIVKKFVEWRKKHVINANMEIMENQKSKLSKNNTQNKLFDDSSSDDNNDESSNNNLCNNKQIIELKKFNFEEKDGKVYLNYDGIANFFQFLIRYEEYFDNELSYASVCEYFEKCHQFIIKASSEIYDLYEKIISGEKFYYFGSFQ